MFSRIINSLKYKLLLSKVKPEMIGYRNVHGETIKNSGASNMTHISNKSNVKIGENVFIGHFNYIDGYANITIEESCQITNYVSILSHSSHHTIRLQGKNQGAISEKGLLSGNVHIGSFSYIGAHSVIMPGTVIGKGSIVSAFSYVSGEFPDFSILRGQPARVVGDTRKLDEELMNKFPELKESYYLRHEGRDF